MMRFLSGLTKFSDKQSGPRSFETGVNLTIVRSVILFVMFFILRPVDCHAKFECDDVRDILTTQTTIAKLQKKYHDILKSKHNWSSRHCFYALFIEDDFDSIYQCLLEGDTDFIDTYLDFVLTHKSYADESIEGYLGLLYLNRVEDVLLAMRKYSHEEIDYLIESILYGAYNFGTMNDIDVDLDRIEKELKEFRNNL